MTKAVSPILKGIWQDTARGCNETAARIFDREKVLQDMRSVALKGYSTYRIVQREAVDLRHTEAANALIAYLVEHGFKVEWIEVRRDLDAKNNPSHMPLTYYELVVKW